MFSALTLSPVSRKPEIEIDFRDVQNLFWQFRDCGGHIFPRIVAKIRPELKLINVDIVVGSQRNRKYNLDFREVQISLSVLFVLKGLRMQFFTRYHKILHAAVKCGWLYSQLLFL